MADATADATADAEPPKGRSKLPLVLGLVLALAGGGGGFYAASSGLLPLGGDGAGEGGHGADKAGDDGHSGADVLGDVAFVPVDPLVISLGQNAANRHLRFKAQLEVTAGNEGAVSKLMPRIVDVLNGYLRAIDVRDLEDPTALIRLRSQMLRRVQIVTGGSYVTDLLVMEFVLN